MFKKSYINLEKNAFFHNDEIKKKYAIKNGKDTFIMIAPEVNHKIHYPRDDALGRNGILISTIY